MNPGEPLGIPVDLRSDGLLWMINRAIFHPRGFALAVDVETGKLSLLGDGKEVWSFDSGDDDASFDVFTALMDKAKNKPEEGK